jgi:hypothetical protein
MFPAQQSIRPSPVDGRLERIDRDQWDDSKNFPGSRRARAIDQW